MPDNIQEALYDMAYNLGVDGLMTFKTFLGLIQQGRYVEAANDLIGTLWAKQVKERALRIQELIKGKNE